MATLIFFLILLSLIHMIYESILVPTIRLSIRYKLFALRDELRNSKIDSVEIPDRIFNYVDNSVNLTINRLGLINLSTLISAARIVEKNPELKTQIEKINSEIESCNSETIKRVTTKQFKYTVLSLIVNNGGLLFYLLPLFLLIYAVSHLFSWIRKVFIGYVSNLNRIDDSKTSMLFEEYSLANLG